MAVLGWPKTLVWKDFGTPVATVPSSYAGTHTDCHISIDISYTYKTTLVKPGGDYQLKDIKVVIKLFSQDTWVLAGVPTGANGAKVLKHEQGHFNIAGIAARDVDKALKALRNPDVGDLTSDATTTADAIIASGQTTEDTYDSDPVDGGTNHGNDAVQQAAWNSKIAFAKSLSDLP